MSWFYDNAKYGVITREWFGLTDKHGGGFTAAYTKGSATCVAKLARFYPRGPIKVLKIGLRVLATLGTPATAPSDGFYYRVKKAGGTLGTDFVNADSANRIALYGVASKEVTATDDIVAAGDYITIKTSTPYSADAATVEAGTINGSFAFFIDWVPYVSKDWDDKPGAGT